jgi:hypothetical protein
VGDVAINTSNAKNPQACILLTTRGLDPTSPTGFGQKKTEWNARARLFLWRKSWAEIANRHLERAGHDCRIDHRSYAERGIALTPTSHLGVSVARRGIDGRDLVRERLVEHDHIVRETGEAIKDDPSIALHALTLEQKTFTRADMIRWLEGRTADDAQLQEALAAVMASGLLVLLNTEGAEPRYTVAESMSLEK